MGAPAGGMNAATRAAVRYCLAHGHTPIGILNGFKGLLDETLIHLTWLRVDDWMTRGGSELGTNRQVPDDNLGAVASKFQKLGFDGLFLIGGFEAYMALLSLEKARVHYPQFHIPMVHLPATISNNVPVTEFSLGTDTSLNALVDACDAIKQSASASRNRVFIVETQGGQCGYLATMGALAVGDHFRLSDVCTHGALRPVLSWCTRQRLVSRSINSDGTSGFCVQGTNLMRRARLKGALLLGMFELTIRLLCDRLSAETRQHRKSTPLS